MAGINAGEERVWKIVSALLDVFRGRTNATGEFTCTTGATSTTVDNDIVSADDAILLMPTTPNAALEWANGLLCIQSVTAGQFVVTHTNSALADRTFRYLVAGE